MLTTVLVRATGRQLRAILLSGLVVVHGGVSACEREGTAQRIGLRYVTDGDTLVLADGRRVRLIGINTPELGRDGRPDEPLANEARLALRQFFEGAETVYVQSGVVSQDHYGRTLAHVFSGARPAGAAREVSAACHLLRSGLAWRVTVPPNLRYQQDYHLAEQQARAKGTGVWSSQRQAQPWASAAGRGFRLLRATITDTEFSRDWWLKTTDDFIVRIAAEDQQYFDGAWLSALVAVEVEIRGWMYRRGGTPWGGRDGKAWVLGLKHPDSIRLLGQG